MGIIDAILRAKKGTRAYLQTQILKLGEFAYETDYKGLKIGDGNTLYSSLEYLILPRQGVDEKYLKVSNGQLVWSETTYDDTAIWNELSLKQDIASLDTDVAALDFVKNTVNNLTNYYLKTETYTQAEVNALIGGLSTFHYEIYPSTSSVTDPQSNVLYLIGPAGSGADKYEEYVYSNNNWVKIGDTSINLSNYVTTTDLNTALSAYTTTTDLNTLLVNYQTKIDANNKLDYSLIDNTPTIPTDTADLTNSAGYITLSDIPAQVQSDWNEADNSNPAYIKNKPTIPAAQVNADWNAISGVAQILNKPTIPTDTGDLTNGAGYITNADIPPIPNGTYIDIAASGWGPNAIIGAYLRSAYFLDGVVPTKVGDYVYSKSTRCLHKITSITQVGGENVANATFIAYFSGFDGNYSNLSGKPTLGTAAALDVPASGDAAMTEVVKGDDTRLTDARTPTSHTHTASEITDLSGTNDGTNWTTITIGSDTYAIPSGGGGGLSDYDFTELSAPTISGGAATVTFVANQRNCVEMSTNADLALSIISNNKSDNYIWINNTHGSNSIDVTFSSIKFGSTTITNIKGTAAIPSIDAGETLEIGIYVNNSKARITSRIL